MNAGRVEFFLIMRDALVGGMKGLFQPFELQVAKRLTARLFDRFKVIPSAHG